MAEKKTTKQPTGKAAKRPVKESAAKSTKSTEKKSKKSRKGLIAGLIAAAVVVVIGVVVALLCINKGDPSDPTANLNYSKAFFIYDDGRYTLWDASGKRLSEDEFENQSNFIAGRAMVKKDGQYGIIKDDGQMAVDFGKYGNITARGGLYLAQDGNTKEYYLLTGNGKELERGDEIEIAAPSSSSGFAVVDMGDKIKVYTYDGKLITETEVVEGADEPDYASSHDFGLFYYNGKNTAFDVRSGEVLAEFEGPQYEFDSVSDSRKMIILENSDESNKYKLIADGKIYDLEETKYYGLTDLDDVIGYDDYSGLALLDDNYKVAKRVGVYLDLKDLDNYAVKNDDGKAEIYYKGEKIKEFGDGSGIAASGVLYEDYYAIKDGDVVRFYNLDGTVGIDHDYKDIYSLFDQHHHAVVSDTDNEYYLIDAKGNQIGDTVFKSFLVRDGGYALKNSDGKYAIANKAGEPVTDFKYGEAYYRSNAEPRNIWTGRNSSDNYDVIDVEKGEVLLEGVNADAFYNNYFTVKGDNKTDYYTYDGVLFYTVEKKD